MATVKGVNRTIADAATASHTLASGKFGGNVKLMVDTYEAAAIATGTIIEMGGDLPIGAKILSVHVFHDALGGSVTLDIGDAEDTDRYFNDYDASAAGSSIATLVDGVEYEVDETTPSTSDRQVLITTAGAAATGTIKLVILYTYE